MDILGAVFLACSLCNMPFRLKLSNLWAIIDRGVHVQQVTDWCRFECAIAGNSLERTLRWNGELAQIGLWMLESRLDEVVIIEDKMQHEC